MPWRCPVCQTTIRHSDLDHEPEPGSRYRCHICRLELEYDAATDKLTVTAFDAERVSPVRPDTPVHPAKPPKATLKPQRK